MEPTAQNLPGQSENRLRLNSHPERIVCITEESVETLYLLGREHLIVGVSSFVRRPPESRNLPKVSSFIKSDIDKIRELQPDLILGFSDIQKDIARDLVEAGFNVFIANHRTINETLSYILWLGRLVGAAPEAEKLVAGYQQKILAAQKKSQGLARRPKVYFEEWNDPMISAITWVSELIEICGGDEVFADLRGGVLASERIVKPEDVIAASPDFIFGCWCGKKVKIGEITSRPGFSGLPAVTQERVFELEPEIFLQPGPALFEDGIDILLDYFAPE